MSCLTVCHHTVPIITQFTEIYKMSSQHTVTHQYMEVHSWQQQLSHNYSSRQEAGYNMPSNRSSLSNHSLVDMLRMVGNSIHCSSHSQQVDNQVALLANLLDRHNLLKTQAQTTISIYIKAINNAHRFV